MLCMNITPSNNNNNNIYLKSNIHKSSIDYDNKLQHIILNIILILFTTLKKIILLF